MLQCYNRGCGKKFNPDENSDDSCLHHPGEPYFHDAYKGWTCCNKKSVDFTEFLNMKGCTQAKHSNIKPPEPVKQEKPIEYEEEQPVEQIRKPIALERPSFSTPLVNIKPKILQAIKNAIDTLTPKTRCTENIGTKSGVIEEGTCCKHGGCRCTYSTKSDETICEYHPGTPIFHEGLKYWSCCQKKTSDFTAFMNQKGCTVGKHKWIKEEDDSKTVQCRYDWHQTATNVIIAVYAKLYHYERSKIQLNPIRLKISLVFPEQNDAEFNLDLELRGIIKVDVATVTMQGTKVEITLPKAEPGLWSKLDYPIKKPEIETSSEKTQKSNSYTNNNSDDSDVDLDDLEAVNMGAKLVNIS